MGIVATTISEYIHEKGKEEGIKEGIKEGRLEVAKQLLDVLDIEIIAKKTGLSLDTIMNLKMGKQVELSSI